MTRALALAAAAAALLAPAAPAAGWRAYDDSKGGFAIAVPAGWQVVPHSTAAVRALVVRLRERHRRALADQFAAIAAARRTQPAVYRFQAFQWPAPQGVAVPDVTVKIDPLSARVTAAGLPVIAAQFAHALGSARGATVGRPVLVRIGAGPTERISGTTRLGKSLRTAYTVYLVVRPRRLYSLAFRCAASQAAAEEPFFRQIADRFRPGR